MSISFLILLLLATTALGWAVAAVLAWLLGGRKQPRTAMHAATIFIVGAIGIEILGLIAITLTLDAAPTTHQLARGLSVIMMLLGPPVLLHHAFRHRMQMTGFKAFGATLVVIVGVAAVQLPIAFAIRATLVEAFVIPTGAMAPNVIGMHHDIRCEHCKYEFAVAPSAFGPNYLPAPPFESVDLDCPNCGLKATLAARTPIRDGDRILTDKVTTPKRWDLIVFKTPDGSGENYIKRLVGLPGETVQIKDGDVYIDGEIEKKPSGSVDDLWILVHDSAYMTDRPTLGWIDNATGIPIVGKSGVVDLDASDAPISMRFSPPIDTRLTYSQTARHQGHVTMANDVRIEIDVESIEFVGDPPAPSDRQRPGPVFTHGLRVSWSHRLSRIEAAVVASNRSWLWLEANQSWRSSRPAPDSSIRKIIFGVRDGSAWLDAHGPHSRESLEQAPFVIPHLDLSQGAETADATPKLNELGELRIDVRGARVVVKRIRIWRDVHYTNDGRYASGSPHQIGDNAYFALGDNSAQSRDCRFFGDVPRGNLVGVARWTYWPPKRWHTHGKW